MGHFSKFEHFNQLETWEKQAYIFGLIAWNDRYNQGYNQAKTIREIIEANPRNDSLPREQKQYVKAAFDLIGATWDSPKENYDPWRIETELLCEALTYDGQEIDSGTIGEAAHFILNWYPEMIYSAVWAKTICGPTFALFTDDELNEILEFYGETVESYSEHYGEIVQDHALKGYNLVMDYC